MRDFLKVRLPLYLLLAASLAISCLKTFLNLAATLLAPLHQGPEDYCYRYSAYDSDLTKIGPATGPTFLPIGYYCELLDAKTGQVVAAFQTATWGPTLDIIVTILAVAAIWVLSFLLIGRVASRAS